MRRPDVIWRVVLILFIIFCVTALKPLKAQVWQEVSPGDPRLVSAEHSGDFLSHGDFSRAGGSEPDETRVSGPYRTSLPSSPYSFRHASRSPPPAT